MGTKIERAEKNLDRQLDWISRYDTRIAFIAGVSIAMLGALVATKNISFLLCDINLELAVLLLATSLVAVFLSQYPLTRSPNSSLLFFGTISTLTSSEFTERFKKLSEDDYLDDVLNQVHANSKILNRKFFCLKAALLLIFIALPFWLITMAQLY